MFEVIPMPVLDFLFFILLTLIFIFLILREFFRYIETKSTKKFFLLTLLIYLYK